MVSLKKTLYFLFFLIGLTDLMVSVVIQYSNKGFSEQNPLFAIFKEAFWMLNLIAPIGFSILVHEFEKAVPKAYLVLSIPITARFLCCMNNFYLLTTSLF